MKKLRLKSWVKKVLLVIVGVIAIYGIVNAYQDRIERINDGTFILVSDSE